MKPTHLPAMPEAAPCRGFRWRCAALLVLITALSACAAAVKDDQDGSYMYQADENFVRLAPVEPGAPPNAHPFTISEEQLSRLLAAIEVRGATSIGKAPVFTKEELGTIVPPLVSALSKAGANQDVTFAVTGHRGFLGRLAPKLVTTGRLFVRDGSLNLIFGLMQERLDDTTLGYTPTAAKTAVVPGARARRVGDNVWRIEPGRGQLQGERTDWLVFDRSAIPAAGPTQAAPATPDAGMKPGGATPSKAREIENRLRVLDSLRERGVITEQEYAERRRAILEQL